MGEQVSHGSWLAKAQTPACHIRAPGLGGGYVEIDGFPGRAPGSASTLYPQSSDLRPAQHCHYCSCS